MQCRRSKGRNQAKCTTWVRCSETPQKGFPYKNNAPAKHRRARLCAKSNRRSADRRVAERNDAGARCGRAEARALMRLNWTDGDILFGNDGARLVDELDL